MPLLERKRDVWENSIPMVFLGHQGLVWDRGVSPLLGWSGPNMAGVFLGSSAPWSGGTPELGRLLFQALHSCICPVQGEGLGCHSASSDSLPLDSPWDLEEITSPGFVKSWD